MKTIKVRKPDDPLKALSDALRPFFMRRHKAASPAPARSLNWFRDWQKLKDDCRKAGE